MSDSLPAPFERNSLAQSNSELKDWDLS